MGNARTEAAKQRKERKRARKAKNANLEILGDRKGSSYPDGHIRQNLRIRDPERSSALQQDLPIRSHVSPARSPQLRRLSLVTREQRGQLNDIRHGLSGFPRRKSPIVSESFPYSNKRPNPTLQPIESWGDQPDGGFVRVEKRTPMIIPLQGTSGTMHALSGQGEVSGGLPLTEGGSNGPSDPSSGCHKFPGVVKPKKRHKKKNSKVNARDHDITRTSTRGSLPGERVEGYVAGMPEKGLPLVLEPKNTVVERRRLIEREGDSTGYFNTVSKHAGLGSEAESGSRKRSSDFYARLSSMRETASLSPTVRPARGMASTVNNKSCGRWASSPPRQGGGVMLRDDDDRHSSLSSRLIGSGLRTLDTVEYSIRPKQPFLRSDNTKRQTSPVRGRASRTLILPVPRPTEAYLLRANKPTQELDRPRDILLILDLNGTLLYRKDRSKSQNFVARPHTEEFLRYLLGKFSVMIWSSATPASVTSICRKLFTEEQRGLLVAEWGRDKLGLTPEQYNHKVQVYKQLEKVWDSEIIAASHPDYNRGRWDQSNTILLDDSALKASAQPHNHIPVPEFKGGRESEDWRSIFNQVMGYLEAILLQRDVSSYIRKDPFKVAEGWNTHCPSE